uniref:Uncharacterized protein n=1 Tax=viral metagenome TaxID=1070528 RepID=A0A6C0DCV6_9ZZZZ
MVIVDTGSDVLSHVGFHIRVYIYNIRPKCLDLAKEKLGVQTDSSKY